MKYGVPMKEITANSLQWIVAFYSASCVLQFTVIGYITNKLVKKNKETMKRYYIPIGLLFLMNVVLMVMALVLLREIYLQSAQASPSFVSPAIKGLVKYSFWLFILSVFALMVVVFVMIGTKSLRHVSLYLLACFLVMMCSFDVACARLSKAGDESEGSLVTLVGDVPSEIRDLKKSGDIQYVYSEAIARPDMHTIAFRHRGGDKYEIDVYNNPEARWIKYGALDKASFRDAETLRTSFATIVNNSESLRVCRDPVQVIIDLNDSTPAAAVYVDNYLLGEIDVNGVFSEDINRCKNQKCILMVDKPKCVAYEKQFVIDKDPYSFAEKVVKLDCK